MALNSDHIIDTIVERHSILKDKMRGCSSESIECIETKYKIILPAVYRDFLLKLGCSRGREPEGTFSFFPQLLDITEEAKEILEYASASFSLKNSAFVFSSHHGYSFLLFYCNGREDPAVHRIIEGRSEEEIIYNSFSEFLSMSLPDLLEPVNIQTSQR